MSIVMLLLKKLIILFAYMMAGLILFRLKIITKKVNDYLREILLYVIFPLVIIYSFDMKMTPENLKGFKMSVNISMIALLVSIIISHMFYNKKSKINNMGVAFSSAGTMGIPIITGVYGVKAVFYASTFNALLTLLQFTYGIMVLTGERKYVSIKKVIVNPIFLSIVIGMVIYLSNLRIPDGILFIFKGASVINGPLAMIILGVYLSETNILEMFKDRELWCASMIRLILIPFVTVFAISIIPGYIQIKMILMMAIAAPVGSNVTMFAKKYGCDYKKSVKLVCLSTIISVIIMPIVIGFSDYIFRMAML